MADNYDKAAYGGQNPRPSNSRGNRRGKYGRAEGGGTNLYGQRYSTGGGFGLQQGGMFNIPLGGFGGGGRRGSAFAEEDLKRQLEYDKAIWERSTPNVSGVGGNVTWDRDTNTVTTSLTPENQAIYDAMTERQGMFGARVNDLLGGGWEDAQQKRFDQMRGMYTSSDAREDAAMRERQLATGASSTGIYQQLANQAALRNERNLGLQNQAFLESQQLINSNLQRQQGDIDTMMNVGEVANRMKVMPVPNTSGNMNYVSSASTAWADLQALEAAKKSKGRSDAWGSILGSLFK